MTATGASRTPDLVSIVIPVFNGARYVGAAIESALAQTWPAVEVIVVNDGSDDGGATQRAIERFGRAVRVIVKPHGGVGSALNAGITAMRGRWFSWLRPDGRYHPAKIERYLHAAAAAGASTVVFGDVDIVDEQGRFLRRAELTRGFSAGDDPRWVVLEGRLHGSAMLIPGDCLAACGWFDTRLPTTHDHAYWFELARRFSFTALRESLVQSRVYAEHGSQQGTHQARHLEEASLLWVSMIERFEAPASPVEQLRRLRRAWRFLDASGYAGARAYVEQRIASLVSDIPVALVSPAGGATGPESALNTLAAAGAWCRELVLLDRGARVDRSRGDDVTRWPAPALTIPLPDGTATPATALRAALAATAARILVCIDPSTPVHPRSLHEGLAAVAADEIDGWFADAEGTSTRGWLGPLSGCVLARAAAEEAVNHGDDALTMLGGRARVRIGASQHTADAPAMRPELSPSPAPRPAKALRFTCPMRANRPTLLLLVHDWGGGTIRYAETIARLFHDRLNVLYGWGVHNQRFFLSSVGSKSPEASYELPTELGAAVIDLQSLQVARIDVMHSIGFDAYLDAFLDRLGIPFDITLLDYHQFATHPHLVDAAGHFVGDDALIGGNHELLRRGPVPSRLLTADRVIACSRDLAGRVQRLAPRLNVIAAKLPEPGRPEQFALLGPALRLGEDMRVLVLGRFGPNKGAALIAAVAALLRRRGSRIQIHCLGAIEDAPPIDLLANPQVRVWGGYADADLHPLVCRIRPHLAWLPFTAPETHSFALSDIMLLGLPVLATGLGAVAERLEGRPSTWIVPPDQTSPEQIVHWLELLQQERLATPPHWLPTSHLPPQTPHFYERDYLRPIAAAGLV